MLGDRLNRLSHHAASATFKNSQCATALRSSMLSSFLNLKHYFVQGFSQRRTSSSMMSSSMIFTSVPYFW